MLLVANMHLLYESVGTMGRGACIAASVLHQVSGLVRTSMEVLLE